MRCVRLLPTTQYVNKPAASAAAWHFAHTLKVYGKKDHFLYVSLRVDVPAVASTRSLYYLFEAERLGKCVRHLNNLKFKCNRNHTLK